MVDALHSLLQDVSINCDCELSFECLIADACRAKELLFIFYNPWKPLILPEPEEIMNKIRASVIWVNDFNAHNPQQGSQGNNLNGHVIEELIDQCNYVIMNDSRGTIFKVSTFQYLAQIYRKIHNLMRELKDLMVCITLL